MKKALRILMNKYVLVTLVFAVWIGFFDQNDIFTMRQRSKDLQATRDNISYLTKEVANMDKERIGILTDPQQLEKFARENYRMKRDNEDVYVVDGESTK